MRRRRGASARGSSGSAAAAAVGESETTAEPEQTAAPAGADELRAAPLNKFDSVKILSGLRAGEEGIVSEVKGDKFEVDEDSYERSELEKLF